MADMDTKCKEWCSYHLRWAATWSTQKVSGKSDQPKQFKNNSMDQKPMKIYDNSK